MNSHPNYEIFEEIGKGSAAGVYRAHDLALKRDVAIKILNERLRADPRRLEEFWEEAQFLAAIRHPNIVQIHGLDKERGWIIMELMRNSLDQLVDKKGLPPDLVRSVLQQVLEALKCLHERKKLHAGIRPANLLIDEQGRIKLSDSAGITVGGEFRKPTGSIKYLAPELVNPEFGTVGPGVDLYNLGFAALELLLGKAAFERLFKGVGAGAVDPEIGWMRWHNSGLEKLPPVRDLLRNLPDDIARVVERLTQKAVDRRYASAEEALQDLENRDLVLVKQEDRSRMPGAGASRAGGVVAIGAAAPPAPPAPEATAVPAAAPPARSRNSAHVASKPWSRAWLNEQLKKPAILVCVLTLILLPVVYALFFMFVPSPEPKLRLPITVDSTPSGATLSVYLEDSGAGEWVKSKNPTKTTVSLAPGKYRIKLELPDRKKPFETTIEVNEEKTFAFDLRARDLARRITLVSDPLGAEIYIDGKKLPHVTGDEFEGPPFPYTLKIVFKDKRSVERVIASADDEKTVFSPPEPPRLVEIRSEPTDAYVFLNGTRQERKTNNKFELPSGPLEIVLKKEGFKDFQQRYEKVPDNLPTFKLIPGEKKTRLVYIETDPPKATVFIDGEKQDRLTNGSFMVPVEPFELRLEGPRDIVGIIDLTRKIDRESAKDRFSHSFRRRMHLATTPPGASVFIDDVKQAKKTNGVFEVPAVVFTLRFEHGERRVERRIDPVKIAVVDMPLPALPGYDHALLVGVHEYGGAVPDFLHAESDAESLGSYLRAADFSPARVTVLTQSRGRTAADQAPTSDNILQKLKFLADTCTESDTVWIGLFGQVLSTADGDFFWPHNGKRGRPETLVPLDRVLSEVRRCAARTKVILLDGWRYSFREGLDDQKHAVRGFRPGPEELKDLLFIGSCRPGQRGYDHLYERHGLFALGVLEGLVGGADVNGDAKITGDELHIFLHSRVTGQAKELYALEQNVSVDAVGLSPGAMTLVKVTPALKNLGLALSTLKKDSAAAEKHLTGALKANAEFVEPYVHRSDAAFDQGRFKDAQADLKVALKLNPNHGLAWSHLGDVEFKLGEPTAFASHTRAIKLEPSFALAHRDRGFLYLLSVQVDGKSKRIRDGKSREYLGKAVTDLKQAVQLNPRNFLAWHDLGQAYMIRARDGGNDFDPAIDALTRALERSIKAADREATLLERAQAFQARAEVHLESGKKSSHRADLRSALKDYAELAESASENKDRYYNMIGSLHESLGDLQEAADSFEAAIRINGKFKQAYVNLGVIYNKLDEYPKAISALEKALALDENFGNAHKYLFAAHTLQAKRERDPAVRAVHEEKAVRHHAVAKKLGAIP